MWIIIQTDTYKEQEVVSDLMKVQGFKDYFLPLYRKERINGSRKDVVFLPLITRMLFLNIDIPDYGDGEHADAEFDGYLRGIFNDSGYILKVEEGKDGGRILTKENVKARLMCVANDKEKSLCQRFRAATILDSDVESLRLFVDQMNSAMTEYSIVDEKYTLLQSTQDTVMFTEGPYQGFQGVVKQKNVNGRRSHYFYLRIANWTFCIPNARRGRYVVFKEATHGKKFREVTAWTNTDLLIGRFQSLSNMVGITDNDALTLADDSASLLRLLLLKLGKKKKIEELVAETASDKYLSSKPLDQLLMLFLCGSKNPKETIGKRKDVVPTLSAEEASALISLNRYYLSTPNTIDYVLSSHIPDVTLRPFLTPYIEQENNFIHHGDFTEHIIKCNLTPYLWQSQSTDDSDVLSTKSIGGGKIEHPIGGQGGFTGGSLFNAHIGVKDNICFVNWGDFTRKCEESKSDEFIADLNKKGLKRLATLLQSDKYTFYKDDKNHIHGFSWPLTGDAGVLPANNLSFFNSLILSSLQPLLAAAVEVWQSTRLLPLRNLLRRCVLLHRDPIIDRLVPINSDMEDILYDKTGMPRQTTDIEYEKLTDYVKKIEHALGNSMAVDGINYAFIICCQMLSSVSGYIESALETNPIPTFTMLDNCCTAAYNAIISFKEHLDNMTCPTSQEETRRKELLKQYEKATNQYAPTIDYLKKSPSYLRIGLPACISKKI